MGTLTRVVPDFGSGSSKSGIWPIIGNPDKSGSGHMSSRIYQIWPMTVQLQYVQLIMEKLTQRTCQVVYLQY